MRVAGWFGGVATNYRCALEMSNSKKYETTDNEESEV